MGAISDYDKMISNAANPADAYKQRGLFKLKIQDYAGAESDLTQSMEINDSDKEVLYNLGQVKYNLNKLDESVDILSKVIKVDPKYDLAYGARGGAYMKKNDFKKAQADFDKAVTLTPTYKRAYYGRGIAKAFQKDYKGSIGDFTKVIELDPDFVQAYYNRAVSKAILGDHKGALPDYDQIIAKDSKNPEAYFNRGISRMNVKDEVGACSDFRKAVELNYQPAEPMVKMYCQGK
jgi:tetratricopeptide (TPR) repeat protein